MPLTRLTLKLTLIPALIFIAIIALIRAQPYDDSELREFLTPPQGCPAPCFMGIRPGVTRVDEALAILENHEWVSNVRVENKTIRWDWSGQQPKAFCRYGGTATFENDIIDYFDLITCYTFGDLSLALGISENLRLIPLDRGSIKILDYAAIYPRESLWVISATACPYFPGMWTSSIGIVFGNLEIVSGFDYDKTTNDIVHMNQVDCRK